MPNSITYGNKQKQIIHHLIESIFDEQSFDNFYAHYFPTVFAQMPADYEWPQRIQFLIEQAAETKQLGSLVNTIKQVEPAGFAAFEQQAKQPETSPRPAPVSPLATSTGPGNFIQNPEILINQSLEDRYRIDEVLDKAGMAAVFKAHDTKFQRDVAIKIIDLNQVEQPAIKERVRQEVQTAMKLENPGIVKIYDYGQAKDLLYIIMEFIAGQNLHEARQRFNLLNLQTVLPEILQMMRQICLTVSYMHQQGVLHPGTKPKNIMLKPDPNHEEGAWQPVLINLGLLRPHREVLQSQKQISTHRLTYSVSPELLLGHATDIRSDIYALGVIFYELVVGYPPFKPTNLTEAVHMHVEEPPRPPRAIKPEVPEAVENIILKALAKNPADRYLSAQEMAQAIAVCIPDSGTDRLALPMAAASHITISSSTSQLVVAPGETLKDVITLYNEGERDERCQVRVEGISAAWVSITPSAMTIAAKEEQLVEMTIQLPRTIESKAGNYPISIQVINQRDQSQIAETKKVLTATGYTQFVSQLYPQELVAGQNTTVTVENQGNRTEIFTVRPRPERGLTFEPDQAKLKLGPGENGTVDFTVISARRFIGDATSQTFFIQVALSQGKAEMLNGAVSTQGILPTKWVVGALIAIGLFICGAISLFQTIGGNLPAAATAQVSNRETVQSGIVVVQATLTQELNATQAAAVAQDLGQDPDRDGLSNAQEQQQYNTDPNNPDTDGDGLPDGQEIDRGTNPLLADSDADGVTDQEELRLGLDPNKPDTDEDGVNDGQELEQGTDPRRQPTPTPAAGPIVSGGPASVRLDPAQFRPTQAGQAPRYDVFENVGTIDLGVELTGPANQLIIIEYNVTGLGFFLGMSGANAGEDYNGNARGTLTFQPGELRKSIRLEIVNDTEPEGPETIRVLLADQSSPPVPLLETEGRIVIIDDDS